MKDRQISKGSMRIYERKILKKYLNRYYRAKRNQINLQARERMLTAESKELAAWISRQEKEAGESALKIVKMLALLPANSTERIIMELRHLDCKSWVQIQMGVHLEAASCFRYYRKGLDMLLNIDEVRTALELNEQNKG